jgi:hypothetical protein
MSASLRNEDYIAFLDESGTGTLQVVSGVFIPVRWLRGAEHRWRTFARQELGSRTGQVEVKSRELLHGEGISLHAQTRQLESGASALTAKAAGRQFFRRSLEHIAEIAEVRVLTVGLPTTRPIETYNLWFWMAYAALVEKSKSPRPRLPLVVIDGEDASFRRTQDLVAYRFYKRFRGCQPYVKSGRSWFVGSAVLQDSKLHPFVQMADLTAGAGRLAMTNGKAPGTWYARHLREHGEERGRDVDVSKHALSLLKRRSRHDACGSGWPDAVLP